jgi:hypothetical protein
VRVRVSESERVSEGECTQLQGATSSWEAELLTGGVWPGPVEDALCAGTFEMPIRHLFDFYSAVSSRERERENAKAMQVLMPGRTLSVRPLLRCLSHTFLVSFLS